MEAKTVKYKLLDPRAKAPAYATPGAAAADLCAVLDEPLTLAPGQRAMIPTGLAIELPDASCVALVYARSGLAIKHGLTLSNSVGVIDSDYRGEILVGLQNSGDADYVIQPADRIAQLMVVPVVQAQVKMVDQLDETQRGAGGFGSTGK